MAVHLHFQHQKYRMEEHLGVIIFEEHHRWKIKMMAHCSTEENTEGDHKI